jgi:hypothetical protein
VAPLNSSLLPGKYLAPFQNPESPTSWAVEQNFFRKVVAQFAWFSPDSDHQAILQFRPKMLAFIILFDSFLAELSLD